MNGQTLDVIIAGAGRVGARTAKILDDHGHSVTVIEPDSSACASLSQAYVATVIEGDATRPSVFRQADPESADVIAALTGHTGVNLGILRVAEEMVDGAEIKTVMRIDKANREEYEHMVDALVYPEGLGGLATVNAIEGADVRVLEDVTGDLEILEIRLAEDAPVAGRTLEEISLPRGSLVVSDTEAERIATGSMELAAGHQYIVATEPAVAEEITQLFRG